MLTTQVKLPATVGRVDMTVTNQMTEQWHKDVPLTCLQQAGEPKDGEDGEDSTVMI